MNSHWNHCRMSHENSIRAGIPDAFPFDRWEELKPQVDDCFPLSSFLTTRTESGLENREVTSLRDRPRESSVCIWGLGDLGKPHNLCKPLFPQL